MTKAEIHPQATVAESARLGKGVRVGAFAVVGDGVELGEGCLLHSHAVVNGPSRFGKNNVFHGFCVIGGDPQDYTFRGERAELIAGEGNIFREYVTVSRVTERETRSYGINTIGLERKGFSPERLQALKGAFRLLLRSKLNTSQALVEMKKKLNESSDVRELIQFIESAERGIVK